MIVPTLSSTTDNRSLFSTAKDSTRFTFANLTLRTKQLVFSTKIVFRASHYSCLQPYVLDSEFGTGGQRESRPMEANLLTQKQNDPVHHLCPRNPFLAPLRAIGLDGSCQNRHFTVRLLRECKKQQRNGITNQNQ